MYPVLSGQRSESRAEYSMGRILGGKLRQFRARGKNQQDSGGAGGVRGADG